MLEQLAARDPARQEEDQTWTILATDRLVERNAPIFAIDYAGQPTKHPAKYATFGSSNEARAWLAEWTGRLNHAKWMFTIFRLS
jgi:hypothetical protein